MAERSLRQDERLQRGSPARAGVQTLMLQLSPDLTAEKSTQILRDTSTPDEHDVGTGWHPQLGYGRINASAALARLGT